MIVRDEEENLKECLESVSFCEEVILVDTGSKDKTVEIAEKFPNVKIFHFDWTGDFAEARNFSLSKATQDWVLVIDADERINDVEGLKKLTQGEFEAYMIVQLSDWDDCWHNCVTTRLWKNFKGVIYECTKGSKVHESPCTSVYRLGLKKSKAYYGFIHKARKTNKDIQIKNDRILDGLIDNGQPHVWMYMGQSYLNVGEMDKGMEYLLKAANSKILDGSLRAFCFNLLTECYLTAFTNFFQAFEDCLNNSELVADNQNQSHIYRANFLAYFMDYEGAIREMGLANKDIIFSNCHNDRQFKTEIFTKIIEDLKLKQEKKNGSMDTSPA